MSKGPSAAIGWGDGAGTAAGGFPTIPRHLPTELFLTVPPEINLPGCSGLPCAPLHIWGTEQNCGVFVRDGRASLCSSKATTAHISQRVPESRLKPEALAPPPSGGDWVSFCTSFGQAGPAHEPDALRSSLIATCPERCWWGITDRPVTCSLLGGQRQTPSISRI